MAGTRQAELRQNAAADGFVVVPGVIGILHLGMGGAVCHIQPLERGHGTAAEQRRQPAAPQIPQKVLPIPAGRTAFRCIVAPAGAGITVIHQGTAGIAVAFEPLHRKAALGGHGHHAMVQQIAVLNVIDAALAVQKFNVLLQFFALPEGMHQLAQH